MTDIHAMNALKSVLGMTINGIAVLVFIVKGAVYWPQAVVMIAGAVVGGYFGAHYSLKLPQAWVRWFVILTGAGMSLYFFVRAY
ncbi:MAG: sulfite exporter TauE/SafE family protein [Acidobacteriia bacterium]|nr:sulfite exporter TauE/SafE family protein [Terriglobia bacterium]